MKCVFSGTRMNTVDLFHAGKQKFKAQFIEFKIIFVQVVFIIVLYLVRLENLMYIVQTQERRTN